MGKFKKTGFRWSINPDTKEGELVLILTRRIGEKLIIGENVTVTILGVKGRQIRIGIDAPRDVTVNREEIFHRIQKEREQLIPMPKKETSWSFGGS